MKLLIDITVISLIVSVSTVVSLKVLFAFFDSCFFLSDLYNYRLIFRDYEAELELIQHQLNNTKKMEKFYSGLTQDILSYNELVTAHRVVYRIWKSLMGESKLVEMGACSGETGQQLPMLDN